MMSNLKLVEINAAVENEIVYDSPTMSYQDYLSSFANTHGYMAAYSCNNTKEDYKDITDLFVKGKYGLDNKYTIVYLYDFIKDSEGYKFIEEYGGKLHNWSSSFITILTYFTEEMASYWPNVQRRDKIKVSLNNKSIVQDTIENIKKLYNVQNLPTLIVIKTDSENKEEYFNVSLSDYKKDELSSIFKETINIINDNCEENFATICNKICGPNGTFKKGNNINSINTYNYVYDLVKQEKKSVYNYAQVDLAAELGITERTLRSKRSKNTFTRDECIYMAIRFRMSIEDLNEFLYQNNQHQLGMANRDGVIRKCLLNGYDVDDTDEILKTNGYHGIVFDL